MASLHKRTEPTDDRAGTPPLQSVSNGHDARGRFAPGNRCGRGNPSHARMRELRKAALAEIGPEEIRRLFRYLFERAFHADVQAARLICSYCLGRAPDDPDADSDAPDDEPAGDQEQELLAETTA